MKKFIDLVDSIRGLELILFSVLLIAFQYLYVSFAGRPNAGFQLYAASWAMSVLTSLFAIKLLGYARGRVRKPN